MIQQHGNNTTSFSGSDTPLSNAASLCQHAGGPAALPGTDTPLSTADTLSRQPAAATAQDGGGHSTPTNTPFPGVVTPLSITTMPLSNTAGWSPQPAAVGTANGSVNGAVSGAVVGFSSGSVNRSVNGAVNGAVNGPNGFVDRAPKRGPNGAPSAFAGVGTIFGASQQAAAVAACLAAGRSDGAASGVWVGATGAQTRKSLGGDPMDLDQPAVEPNHSNCAATGAEGGETRTHAAGGFRGDTGGCLGGGDGRGNTGGGSCGETGSQARFESRPALAGGEPMDLEHTGVGAHSDSAPNRFRAGQTCTRQAAGGGEPMDLEEEGSPSGSTGGETFSAQASTSGDPMNAEPPPFTAETPFGIGFTGPSTAKAPLEGLHSSGARSACGGADTHATNGVAVGGTGTGQARASGAAMDFEPLRVNPTGAVGGETSCQPRQAPTDEPMGLEPTKEAGPPAGIGAPGAPSGIVAHGPPAGIGALAGGEASTQPRLAPPNGASAVNGAVNPLCTPSGASAVNGGGSAVNCGVSSGGAFSGAAGDASASPGGGGGACGGSGGGGSCGGESCGGGGPAATMGGSAPAGTSVTPCGIGSAGAPTGIVPAAGAPHGIVPPGAGGGGIGIQPTAAAGGGGGSLPSLAPVRFLCSDFLAAESWADADLVFAASLCFPPELVAELEVRSKNYFKRALCA